MKRYKITIALSNGDKVEAKAVGENQADAIERLEKIEKFHDFVGVNQIDDMTIEYIGDVTNVVESNFALQYDDKNDRYIVADKRSLVMASFEKGRFNETAKITDLNDDPILDAQQMATILREIGEFIITYHPELN